MPSRGPKPWAHPVPNWKLPNWEPRQAVLCFFEHPSHVLCAMLPEGSSTPLHVHRHPLARQREPQLRFSAVFHMQSISALPLSQSQTACRKEAPVPGRRAQAPEVPQPLLASTTSSHSALAASRSDRLSASQCSSSCPWNSLGLGIPHLSFSSHSLVQIRSFQTPFSL